MFSKQGRVGGVYIGCVVLEQIGIACERARFPHLDGEPFALAEGGSNPAVRAVSDEAARWGVAAGQTVSGARTLCPDLIVLRYDKPAYEAAARSVWDLLAAMSDVVEPISPEMAFVVLSERFAERDAALLAASLSRAVGVPVQVGVGRSKLVAERAARAVSADKGNAPVLIPVGEEVALLASLPVAHVASLPRRVVGRINLDRQMLLRLERLGIRVLGDMVALPLERLPRALRPLGQLLRDLAYGVDRDPVRPLWPPRTLTEEVRFDDEAPVTDRFLAENALRPLAAKVACALPDEGHFCRSLTVRAGLLDGTFIDRGDRFVVPLSQAGDLHRHAVRLLGSLPVDQPITSLALIATELGAGSGAQLALPALADARTMPAEVRRVRLEATVDYLRREFGLAAVMTGTQMYQSRRAVLHGARPLGHLLSAPIRVATDAEGRPARYWHRARGRREASRYEVRRSLDRWREARWKADLSVVDAEVFRVETDPAGISDLRRVGAEWRLTGYMG
jgi:DNA polymerase-4